MPKLPYTLLFVTLALVVLNIVLLKHVSKLEERVITLEQKMNGAHATP